MTAAAPFELAIERHIDAPPQTVFKVWTERLEEWWAPKPWTTRKAVSIKMLGASAHSTDPAMKIPSATNIISRRPKVSPRRP